MPKPNVGLIGVGKWGSFLKEKLSKHSNLIFYANSKTKYLSKLKNVNWVFVATPDKTHYKIVKRLINLNKNIFCEKPLTLHHDKSKELFNLAKKRNIILYVDDIQTYYQKKIKLFKENFITRRKKGVGNPKDLLYRFAYHDFYYLADKLKKKKIKSILIKDITKDLRFDIVYKDNSIYRFYYSLRFDKKVHKVNNFSFVTKKDLLSVMIKKVLKKNVNFKKNEEISLFSNKLIDEVKKKLS